MSAPRTVEQLLAVGRRVLEDSTHIFEDHDRDAETREFMALCLRVDGDDLEPDRELSPRVRDRFLAFVARRAAGEPFPVLTGHIEFYGIDLKVKPGAFVPRPSSELTVVRASGKIRRRRDPVVVDVCAGAGPIAIALADEFPAAEVWALDIDEQGLRQGRENARRLGIGNVKFRRGDMFAPLPKRLTGEVDLIAAHLPYVPSHELDDLPSEIKDHEPVHTLTDSSPDGLGLMRRTVEEGARWLRPGGWLLLEMSEDIAPKARRLIRKVGLEDRGAASDEDGLSVVVEARR